MNAILKTVGLSPANLIVEDYSGFDLTRRFYPHLRLYSLSDNLYLNVESYDKVWQFLDTICYKEPLGRKNFNHVLKHRVQDTEHTSLEIISGVIKESDIDAITLQGEIKYEGDKETLYVDFVYSHFDEDIHPPLVEIASVLDSYSASSILFSDFELVTRSQKNDWKRLVHTFPSIIGIIQKKFLLRSGKAFDEVSTIIRCVQFPNGNLGFFANTFVDNRKYACGIPAQLNKMDDKAMDLWIKDAIKERDLLYEALSKRYNMPQWKQENTSGSTVAHYKTNGSLLKEALKAFVKNDGGQ